MVVVAYIGTKREALSVVDYDGSSVAQMDGSLPKLRVGDVEN